MSNNEGTKSSERPPQPIIQHTLVKREPLECPPAAIFYLEMLYGALHSPSKLEEVFTKGSEDK